MSTSNPGRIKELWYRWKSLKLPWRRKWLVGRDLTGVTFWELRSQLDPSRTRRVAQYPRTVHYADVAHSPAWMQWLRHTRRQPPSIAEQQLEIQRQQNLRQLAAAADQRWAQKPSLLDKPEDTGQVGPQMQPRDPGGYAPQTEEEGREGVMNAAKSGEELEGLARGEDVDQGRFKGASREKPRDAAKADPWKKPSGPSEGWQPQAWQPQSTKR